MAKITLNAIVSGYASTTALDTLFQQLEDELNNKVLYRDNPVGEPNQLEVDIDMNSNRIVNLPPPSTANEPVILQQILDLDAGIAAASTTSLVDVGGYFTSDNVEGAIQEIGATNTSQAASIATNAADIATNAASIATNASNISTNATNLTNHLTDTVDAHDASAISVVPAGNLASTEVQAALQELQGDIDAIVVPGVGQTWTSFTIGAGPTATHRQDATIFTNTTGTPIMVNIVVSGTVATGTMDIDLEVDGLVVARSEDVLGTTTHTDTLSAIVPDGVQYRTTGISQANSVLWRELR